jgi:hypothetical protein
MAVLRRLHQLQGLLKANGGARTSVEELTSKGGSEQQQADQGSLRGLLQAVAAAKEAAADVICGPHRQAAAAAKEAEAAAGGGREGEGAGAAGGGGEGRQEGAGWRARLLGELLRLGRQVLNALMASLVLMLALWVAGRLPHQRERA